MDFNLSDEQAMLADAVGRWLAADYDFAHRRRVAAGEEAGSADWQQLAELGLLGVNVPEDDGGLGGGSIEAAIVMQAFGRSLVVEPYLATAVVAAPLIARIGTAAQRAALLPGIVAGERRVVVGAHEPDARFDLDHVATTAVTRDGGFRLAGRKTVVTGADSAHVLIVPARTAGGTNEQHGISLFLVPVDARGVERRMTPAIDGTRSAEVTLHDVEVDRAALLGPLHGGYDPLEQAIDCGIAGLCAEAVGVMERLLETTAQHLRTRRQFGQPIGAFQALQHRVADMAIAVEQARSTSLLAAAKVDDPDRKERRRAVSAAKVLCGQSGRFVGEQAVQLHGGMGMTDALDVGWYFKRLVCIDLIHGDADHHLELFGASM